MLVTAHRTLPPYRLHCDAPDAVLFTENETNFARLFGSPNASPYVKDAFHEYVVHGRADAVNPAERGTKAAAHYVLEVPARSQQTVCLRLSADDVAPGQAFGPGFDRVIEERDEEHPMLPDPFIVSGRGMLHLA